MGIGRTWTEAEISILDDLISQGATLLDIAEKLNRSPKAITSKCNKMYGTGNKKGENWTEPEVMTLRRMSAQGKSDAEIGRVVHRSAESVKWKRWKLNSKKPLAGHSGNIFLPFDGDKMRRIFKEKNLSVIAVSRELGCVDSTLGDYLRENIISKQTMLAITAVYGIKYEDVKLEEAKPEPTGNPKKFSDYDMEMLYQLMLRACEEAVKKVWTEL